MKQDQGPARVDICAIPGGPFRFAQFCSLEKWDAGTNVERSGESIKSDEAWGVYKRLTVQETENHVTPVSFIGAAKWSGLDHQREHVRRPGGRPRRGALSSAQGDKLARPVFFSF